MGSHPWVGPPPSPVRPAPHHGWLVLHKLTQGRLGGIHIRVNKVFRWDFTNLLRQKKIFRLILSNARKRHIPWGYIREYYGPLPKAVQPIIAERDQCNIDNLLKLLDRDIQQHIRQEAGILDCSDRATCLSTQDGDKRSKPPPNTSIALRGKIAQGFAISGFGSERQSRDWGPPSERT